MSAPLTLRERAGQCLMVGVEGTELTTLEAAWLRLVQPAGVILFARNISSPLQTRALLAAVQQQVRMPLFTGVDLEGGTVDRLRSALAPMPSATDVAAVNNEKASRLHGKLIGEACALFGFNVTFAPVLDLALPESRPVMTTRTAGETAAAVLRYAEPFLKGLEQTGTMGCGKHFPGLGGGTLDSHHHLPQIPRTLEQLRADITPYRELRGRLPMVMVSHAAYPAVTGADEPASLSPFWIRKALRKGAHYKGLVLSDDLEMQPVLSRGMARVVPATLLAGVDVALICHRADLVLSGYESLLHEAEHAWALRDRLTEASENVARLKKKMAKPLEQAPDGGAADRLAGRIHAFSEELQRDLERIRTQGRTGA